jgi:hypothetical protein
MLEKNAVFSHHVPRRKRSATALGLRVYMLSAPEGTPVDLQSLGDRFSDKPYDLAAALREMEADGYLRLLCEYTAFGRRVTRRHGHRTEAGTGPVSHPAQATQRAGTRP